MSSSVASDSTDLPDLEPDKEVPVGAGEVDGYESLTHRTALRN